MLLKSPDQIPAVITGTHFSVIEFPTQTEFPRLSSAIAIQPNDKNNISIEEIHDIASLVRSKQFADLIIVLHHADHMTASAQNAFLKLLEEPGDHIHFAFFTHHASNLLPTIHSRAHVYTLASSAKILDPPQHDPKTIQLAKTYISATPAQLAALSQKLAKDRTQALTLLDAAIELLYKSYFQTKNPKLLAKLSKLLQTHAAISNNGHVRLQLVAGML